MQDGVTVVHVSGALQVKGKYLIVSSTHGQNAARADVGKNDESADAVQGIVLRVSQRERAVDGHVRNGRIVPVFAGKYSRSQQKKKSAGAEYSFHKIVFNMQKSVSFALVYDIHTKI